MVSSFALLHPHAKVCSLGGGLLIYTLLLPSVLGSTHCFGACRIVKHFPHYHILSKIAVTLIVWTAQL